MTAPNSPRPAENAVTAPARIPGSTSGRCTNASNSMRPGKRARVRSQAMSTANGRLKATLRRATSRLRRRASSSAELGTVGSEERYEQPGGAEHEHDHSDGGGRGVHGGAGDGRRHAERREDRARGDAVAHPYAAVDQLGEEADRDQPRDVG